MTIVFDKHDDKYDICMKSFIGMSDDCKILLSKVRGLNLNSEVFERIKLDLEEMSRKCEDYANLFDAYKRRLEEETIINDVYATPDIMRGRLPK